MRELPGSAHGHGCEGAPSSQSAEILSMPEQPDKHDHLWPSDAISPIDCALPRSAKSQLRLAGRQTRRVALGTETIRDTHNPHRLSAAGSLRRRAKAPLHDTRHQGCRSNPGIESDEGWVFNAFSPCKTLAEETRRPYLPPCPFGGRPEQGRGWWRESFKGWSR